MFAKYIKKNCIIKIAHSVVHSGSEKRRRRPKFEFSRPARYPRFRLLHFWHLAIQGPLLNVTLAAMYSPGLSSRALFVADDASLWKRIARVAVPRGLRVGRRSRSERRLFRSWDEEEGDWGEKRRGWNNPYLTRIKSEILRLCNKCHFKRRNDGFFFQTPSSVYHRCK